MTYHKVIHFLFLLMPKEKSFSQTQIQWVLYDLICTYKYPNSLCLNLNTLVADTLISIKKKKEKNFSFVNWIMPCQLILITLMGGLVQFKFSFEYVGWLICLLSYELAPWDFSCHRRSCSYQAQAWDTINKYFFFFFWSDLLGQKCTINTFCMIFKPLKRQDTAPNWSHFKYLKHLI